MTAFQPSDKADSVGVPTLSDRTVDQVNAALDGCDHDDVRRITPTFPGGVVLWACRPCGQRFGPIFTEQPRRNGDPTIREVFSGNGN